MQPTRDQLLSTFNAFLSSLSPNTIPAINTICTLNCLHHMGPSTTFSNPPWTHEQYMELMKKNLTSWSWFQIQVKDGFEPVVDMERRRVMAICEGKGEKPVVGDYLNEYMFVVRVTDDGDRIEEVVEWLDTRKREEFVARTKDLSEK